MTEGDPKNSKDKPVSDFDMLVGGLKKLTSRVKKEGRIVPETPAIDRYVAKKKKQAGSPPDVLKD